jgi:hypothetical protein
MHRKSLVYTWPDNPEHYAADQKDRRAGRAGRAVPPEIIILVLLLRVSSQIW